VATLYETLETEIDDVFVVGFADDTNLMSFGKDGRDNCRRLQAAWEICDRWAFTRGMVFAPTKSELVHFTRAHKAETQDIRLGNATVKPLESAKFLGVWLDRKLRWAKQLEKLNAKFATQQFALTRIAASTWGCSLARAREVYTKVIRNALAYGASAWHTPSEDKPRGIARSLLTAQSSCLRVVAGAYRATPIRSLEVETHIPPLDIYLNRRVADFEARLEASGKGNLIRNACTAIAARLRRRGHRPRPRPSAPATAAIVVTQ